MTTTAPLAHAAKPIVPRLATDLARTKRRFEVVSDYEPAGDQPAAIKELARRLGEGRADTVLLGATGTGKSATTAWLVEQVQRPCRQAVSLS